MKDAKSLARKGLTAAEAERRLREFGENAVFKKKKIGPFLIFLSKLKNPIFLLMIAVSAVSFFMGAISSAVIVVLMVLLSAGLDFLNTYKSQQSVEKLASRVATRVTVVELSVRRLHCGQTPALPSFTARLSSAPHCGQSPRQSSEQSSVIGSSSRISARTSSVISSSSSSGVSK